MARAQAFEQDKNFLQNQIIESKRQNKLLKLAIGRIQGELEQREQTIEELNKPIPITMANIDQQLEMHEGQGNTFMTEAQMNNIVRQGQQPPTDIQVLTSNEKE